MEMIVMRKFILTDPWRATQERVDEEAAGKGKTWAASFIVISSEKKCKTG